MAKRAAFIVLEGGEGSGKTTILAALTEALAAARHNVLATREPGGTTEGLALRKLLLASGDMDWDPGAELLLMTAARIQHVKRVIKPALAEGSIVLCDRYLGSTLAYQGVGRGLDRALIEHLHEILVGLNPDLTILLDVEPHLGLARSVCRLQAQHSNENRFESLNLAFHERVRADFLAQAKETPNTHLIADANRDLSLVVADVVERVMGWLTK